MKTGNDKTGVDYELLVQGIFQVLHNQLQATNIQVKRNVTLQGKHTSHQIDVYWEFEIAGVKYQAVVQAKDWTTKVKKGQLLEFKAVLDDLPGQPRGIFVTRSGYQQGARDLANAHGIILYELNEAPSAHFTVSTIGWIKFGAETRLFRGLQADGKTAQEEVALGINGTVFQPECSNITFQPDDKAPPKIRTKKKLKLAEALLYDEQHNRLQTLEDVVREEMAVIRQEQVITKHITHEFQQPAFLGPPSMPSFVKVKSVSFDVEVKSTYFPARFNLSKFVQFVLHEIVSGEKQTFIHPRPQQKG